jgi:NADH:ubiquinone oxidoreductase subunit F (NADH-binding)
LETSTFEPAAAYAIGGLGDSGTWLLSGPPESEAAESLDSHASRWGVLDPWSSRDWIREVIRTSGIEGRGGGGFPLSRKLDTAILAPGRPVVVVNASESEPASRKDRTLVTFRPHLVLDGAAAVASVVGADRVIVHFHRGSETVGASLARAMAERRAAGRSDPPWQLSAGPDNYVSGEASAIAALLEGGEARPHFSAVPMAHVGPSGRPTVVNNAETMAQVMLAIHRSWSIDRAADPPSQGRVPNGSSPASRLFTLIGAVETPGRVVELTGAASIGELLAHAGVTAPPSAVLMGGYAGTWIDGYRAWTTLLDRDSLRGVGSTLGCGLVGVLPAGRCGLVETAGLVGYLAGETAGQCGPCVHGLPRLASACAALAAGRMRPRGLRKLVSLAEVVDGGGACSHPDGVVRLIRSALTAFEADVDAHLSGRACEGAARPPVFPVPSLDPDSRVWR